MLGQATIALSISEPDAGSAATDMTARAVMHGDEVVLNGIKRWCSGAGHAEQYLVYARLGDGPGARGIGALLIDRDAPRVTFGPPERLMGFRGIPSADIFLQDVAVPVENVIVPAGGFSRLFGAFSIERLGNATMSLAVAQTALDRSAAYVKERCEFGRPIARFQMVQASLAEMIVQVEGARQLVYQAASRPEDRSRPRYRRPSRSTRPTRQRRRSQTPPSNSTADTVTPRSTR